MISLHCTKCNALLEMDDGFAGGVCRCQYCKTIQTVPSKSKAKPSAKSMKPKSMVSSSRGTGLDELAEVVASSGLSRGSLTKPPAQNKSDQPQTTTPVKSNPMVPILIGAAALVAILVGVVIYLLVRPAPVPTMSAGRSANTGSTAPVREQIDPQKPSAPVAAAAAGPAFANVPLPSGPVVFLLDQSQANGDFLDAAKAAVYRSILSLGPDRKFQIIFWKRENEPIVSYPEKGLASATPAEVAAATKRFEDVVSYGATDLKPALQKAIAADPAAIVVTTAKSFFGEENLAIVQGVVKNSPVKIHTFALGESDNPVLKQIAKQTGGEYHAFDLNQLKSWSH